MTPTPEDIKALRKRHRITQDVLADSLYGIKRARVPDWEAGRRTCSEIIWWAIWLTWEKEDLWLEENTLEGK